MQDYRKEEVKAKAECQTLMCQPGSSNLYGRGVCVCVLAVLTLQGPFFLKNTPLWGQYWSVAPGLGMYW